MSTLGTSSFVTYKIPESRGLSAETAMGEANDVNGIV